MTLSTYYQTLSYHVPLSGTRSYPVSICESKSINISYCAKNSLRITINEEFKKKYLNGDFFADYDSDINLEQFDYSVLSLPCIMNLISLVWISGKTYYIEEMDTELFDSLDRVKEVFICLYPNTLWDGQLIPRTLKQHTYTFHGSDHTALLVQRRPRFNFNSICPS